MMNRRSLLRLLSVVPVAALLVARDSAAAEVKGARTVPVGTSRWPTSTPGLAFLVVGDWGAGGRFQRRVAAGMDVVAARNRPAFVLSTGDNIYPDGVDSADDRQWTTKFTSVYDLPHLGLPWWAVLGNHDYRKDPDAQIAYHDRNPQWNMPARWYRQDFSVDGETKLALFALDTQAMLTRAANVADQLAWFERELAAASAARWKVVVGHHPLRSYGHYGDQEWLSRRIKPMMVEAGVQLYCCGHDHDIQLVQHPSDPFLCALSGAGGGARSTVWGEHTRYAHTNGGFLLVRCTAEAMEVHVHDADGTMLFVQDVPVTSRR